MGNCSFKTEAPEKTSALSSNNFDKHCVIGKGGFGKVWKVERKKTRVLYAMKEMSKARVLTKKSVLSVMNEKQLLSVLKHMFIVNMIYAFQDRENLYLVMDLLTGGDLRYHINKHRKFSEEQTKFFIACIITGLEYLHSSGVLHRDIKPENLVFDSKGYLRITDFGIARAWRPDNESDTSGTPGYMAPEVMCKQNHGVAVDYYAVGVIAYECMLGQRPYNGRNRKEIRDQILAKQVQIKRNEIPEGWSLEAADFINKLIQRKPINRLGLDGPKEVKEHPWLKDYAWHKMNNKELESPYNAMDGFDMRQNVSDSNWEDENDEIVKQNALLLRRSSVQSLFNGYQYDSSEAGGSGNVQNLLKQQQQLTQSFNGNNTNQTMQTLSASMEHNK